MSISYTELSHFIHFISKYSSASCFPSEVTVATKRKEKERGGGNDGERKEKGGMKGRWINGWKEGRRGRVEILKKKYWHTKLLLV